jgi:hypothetical protein
MYSITSSVLDGNSLGHGPVEDGASGGADREDPAAARSTAPTHGSTPARLHTGIQA